MEWDNMIGWLEYEGIEHPLIEYYDDREYFNDKGEWMDTAFEGYDFKGLEDCGFIYHWTTVSGWTEYILRVPRERFDELLHDYLYEEGREAMAAYDEWEYKDGVYVATRTVE